MQDYVGVYRAGGDERVVRVVDGTLTIQKKGASRWNIEAIAPDEYVRADTLHAVRFERSADGHVSGLRVGTQDTRFGPLIARVADPLPADPVGVPVPREVLERLAGTYWRSGTMLRVTLDGNTLRGHVIGQRSIDMVALSPTRFEMPRAACTIELGEGSPAQSLILFQHGGEHLTRMQASFVAP